MSDLQFERLPAPHDRRYERLPEIPLPPGFDAVTSGIYLETCIAMELGVIRPIYSVAEILEEGPEPQWLIDMYCNTTPRPVSQDELETLCKEGDTPLNAFGILVDAVGDEYVQVQMVNSRLQRSTRTFPRTLFYNSVPQPGSEYALLVSTTNDPNTAARITMLERNA
ncbi:hypothetical protein KY362_07385 [Candidatus Woesearchaeota archaeon]|nr:hypothetical protein [Candidatus Woesearchaeota archaeon]